MADVFNIAGRIHSTSQEEVVTTTNEILDATQEKKQNEVNQEVSEELALHTNRLNALTGQNYVTVVATQSTTVADIPTLINATGEGEQEDTLYRVGFWDGSSYVADKYTEYAWNGTAYVILDVKSSIGEVFDISQYNAVGGTLATYADLAAALGPSGANVPSSVRRGGMSINFVCSSDNKYVQYRLTNQNWSTITSDWVNINYEPIAIQNKADISELTTLSTSSVVEGYLFNANGVVVTNNSFDIYKFVVEENSLYTFSGRMGSSSSFRFIAWFDNNDQCIKVENYSGPSITYVDELVKSPEGAAYAWLNVQKNVSSQSKFKEVGDSIKSRDLIAQINTAINTLDNKIDDYNVRVIWEQGRIASDGTNAPSDYAIRSKDYISIDSKRRSIAVLFSNYPVPSDATAVNVSVLEYSSIDPVGYIGNTNYKCYKNDMGNFVHTFGDSAVAFKLSIRYETNNTFQIYPSDGCLITVLWAQSGLSRVLNSTQTGYEISTDKPDIKFENYYIGLDEKGHTSELNIGVTDIIELNAGDKLEMYFSSMTTVYALAETDENFSYFKGIYVGSANYETYTINAEKHMYVCATVRTNTSIEYIMKLSRKLQYSFIQPIDMSIHGIINNYGETVLNFRLENYYFSKPFKVYKGDIVDFSYYAVNGYPTIIKFFDRFNTYYASKLGTTKIMRIATETGNGNTVWIADETCYIVVQSVVSSSVTPECRITRSYDSERFVQISDEYETNSFGKERHNFVDIYDFVPNLEKKRTNSILTYSADNKKSENFIVNAVAYPNGEIIACRAGGDVVKIANDGTETVLLTIANAQDWRGMFMDSNLNVYVSPHSSSFSPGISPLDRGLYRLAYGSNTFVKVISLCRSTTEITEWQANTNYAVNDKIMRDNQSDMYICNTAHTSTSAFDETKWTPVPDWVVSTSYSEGDLVKYNKCYFRCIEQHTSTSSFEVGKWNAATEYMENDDTIWTMCEDENGFIYAGVYAHSKRANPAVYKSTKPFVRTFFYQHNFIMNGTLPRSVYGGSVRHVHCINFNPYDNCLYAAVGEVNTIVRSDNHGGYWEDLHTPCYYGQPTYILGVKDGLVIGSDGHYSCGVSKLMTDLKTMKLCGRTAPGFIFNIRRSDLTGWLYAWTRIDNFVQNISYCPPPEAIDDPAVLESWLETYGNTNEGGMWQDYHEWAVKYYPEDAIRPQNVVIMVSKDEGETWEVIKTEKVSSNYANICGFITVGYFRDGECLAGLLKPIEGTTDGKAFVQPVVISEGKKKRTTSGFDLDGEIFIKTNTTDIVPY